MTANVQSGGGIPADYGGGGASGGGGGSRDGSGAARGENEEDGDEEEDDYIDLTPIGIAQALLSAVLTLLESLNNFFQTTRKEIIVMITALITATLNYFYQRQTAKQNHLQELKRKQADREKENMQGRFKFYLDHAVPLLKTAGKLQDMLYIIASDSESPEECQEDGGYKDALHLAYLVARYQCLVAAFRESSPTMDFGRPEQDRIFSNVIGRIQVILASSEEDLAQTYARRGPHVVRDADAGGAMFIPSYSQASIGGIMQRDRWNSYPFKCGRASNAPVDKGLNFPEFLELYETNAEFVRWFRPIVVDMERFMQSPLSRRQQCARIQLLQGALLDLVGLLDPSPQCRIVPPYRRRRLRVPFEVMDTMMPSSLRKLYMKNVTVNVGKPTAAQKQTLDVFISGPPGDGTKTDVHYNNVIGDCPHSQKILMALIEKKIDHNIIAVDRLKRPTWFYNIHPDGLVPVILHGGQIINDSGNILRYLEVEFPRSKPLALSNQHIAADPFQAIEGSRDAFLAYLADPSKEPKMMCELDKLEGILRSFINRRRGPYFGGRSLSMEDVTLMPYLYHLNLVGRRLRHFSVDRTRFPCMVNYMKAMNRHPTFKTTRALPSNLLFGYEEIVRGVHPAIVHRVSDIPD